MLTVWLPVHHHSANYNSFFGDQRILYKPVLAGAADVEHFITGHEQTHGIGTRYSVEII